MYSIAITPGIRTLEDEDKAFADDAKATVAHECIHFRLQPTTPTPTDLKPQLQPTKTQNSK